MARKLTEADKASDRETEYVHSSMYIKLSNMWRKGKDVYVERQVLQTLIKARILQLLANS